jgi:DNA-binding transcriptional regulator YiaG
MQGKCNQDINFARLSGDMDRLVQNWTGRHADSLRQAMRMTNESFAEHLGVAVRTVAYWRHRPDLVPSPAMQEILDTALIRSPQRAKDHFWELAGAGGPADGGPADGLLASQDASSLTDWLTATSVSDEAITGLDRAAARLAEAHAQVAPAIVLAEARQVQVSTQALLRAGQIRHRQTRELLRINGNLLAHISLLLSDLGDNRAGEEYGNASRAYLHEAGASEATACYVLAKNARWRHDYALAADLARSGLEHSARDPMKVQLACYEANTAALAGDPSRALNAMRLAEETWAVLPPGQMTPSPWSFPTSG